MKSGKSEKPKKEKYNKEIGNRLKYCRKLRGYTQESFAEKTNYSEKYISMLETAYKPMDKEKANIFASILNVNPDYLLCESDIIDKDMAEREKHRIDKSHLYVQDECFLYLLKSLGYEIQFEIIPFLSINTSKKTVNIKDLEGIDLSHHICYFIDGDTKSECSIRNIIINNNKIPFENFFFIVKRIYDYLYFTMDRIDEFSFDLDMVEGGKLANESEIKEKQAVNSDEHFKILEIAKRGNTVSKDENGNIIEIVLTEEEKAEFKKSMEEQKKDTNNRGSSSPLP